MLSEDPAQGKQVLISEYLEKNAPSAAVISKVEKFENKRKQMNSQQQSRRRPGDGKIILNVNSANNFQLYPSMKLKNLPSQQNRSPVEKTSDGGKHTANQDITRGENSTNFNSTADYEVDQSSRPKTSHLATHKNEVIVGPNHLKQPDS